ncbi:hypothetical protein Daus18300_004433 [Diaporthe australafricana]|uniref:RNase H type-1 domain-containing protein n=1 Tax=Diaporthe australafricana TaxID=127596 RepID=A0ABR3X805_9PEZI
MTKKKPLAKRPTIRGRKLARSAQRQENLARKATRKANYHNELALLRAVTAGSDLHFCGEIIIQSREAGILAATDASGSAFNPSHRVFFASGVSIPGRVRYTQEDGACQKTGMRSAGAAVVYRRRPGADNHIWQRNLFGLGVTAENRSIEAGLLAVAECLAIAATEMARAKDQATSRKVTIFTDCRAAMDKIDKFRHVGLTEQQLRGIPIRRKLITRSQYLSRHLGVDVELRWVPRHSGAEGSRNAEAAAQKAAMTVEPRKGGDSLDKGLQALIENASQSGSKRLDTQGTPHVDEQGDHPEPKAGPIVHEATEAKIDSLPH